jgi:catechol 2,3-dioxygenase-like lactoylglutathione lyase family enzyme
MIKGIDHVVILVRDLDQAVANYKELGFNVTPGGEHTDGATHNALVAFADGSYLELIAFKRAAPEHRWWRHALNVARDSEGLIDFALLPTAIESDIAAARQRGLDYKGPFPGGRQRPDGVEIRWQTGQPTTSDLPFLCGDITPRTLRVPSGPAWVHPNGITGIDTLVVLVRDVEESAGRYQALLGSEPHDLTGDELDAVKKAGGQEFANFKEFALGPSKIILAASANPKGEIDEQLLKVYGGGGPFSLRFKAPQPVTFDPLLTGHIKFTTI